VVVETSRGAELNVIALMGYNPGRDLAILAVLEGSLPALETGPADIVKEGDRVMVAAPDKQICEASVGSIRAVGGVDLIPISAPAPAGSPVLSQGGKVIGLATRHKIGGESLTFAVPSRYISDILAEHRVLSFEQMLDEVRLGIGPGTERP
jgi:hypothetical protein